MHALISFLLSRLAVALVALCLASAPLYAAFQPRASDSGLSAHVVQTTHTSHGQPDHRQGGASKPYAAGQFCCHPGCIMALVPTLARASLGLPLSEVVPITADLAPPMAMLSGIDRPPKRS